MKRRNAFCGRSLIRLATFAGLTIALPSPALGLQQAPAADVVGGIVPADTMWAADAPSLKTLVEIGRQDSDLRLALRRYAEDAAALRRRYDIPNSPVVLARQRAFQEAWLRRLKELDFNSLNREGQIDYILLRHRIEFELAMLDEQERNLEELAPLIPFARRLQELQDAAASART